ncbi:MAG TPA: ArgE/DapE family deacylase [Anaerolineae bacterium]|nr:ArgE/DapE family deacylase [Anaerolineae bacterium]
MNPETLSISELEKEILRRIDDGYVVDLLQKLVRIPSIAPPCQLEEIASFVGEEMRSYGLTVVTAGDHGQGWARPNVLATLDAAGEEWGLILNAHTDVVPPYDLSQWKVDPFAGEIIDGTISGRGTADTKGSLAAMMAAARAIAQSGVDLRKTLAVVAWAGDEWAPPDAGWFNGETYMATHGFLKPAPYIGGEPYDLKICYISRGRIWFDFVVGGEATHSATGKGINAILKAIKLIQGVYQINVGRHTVLGADTINVGTIRGGTQTNMVPDECTLTFDIRFAPPLTTSKVREMVEQVVKDLEGADPDFKLLHMEIPEKREPIEFPRDGNLVQAMLRAGKVGLGQEMELGGAVSFGDIEDWKDQVGIVEACLFGPGETKQAHAINEHIEVDDLISAAKVYALTALYCCGGAG